MKVDLSSSDEGPIHEQHYLDAGSTYNFVKCEATHDTLSKFEASPYKTRHLNHQITMKETPNILYQNSPITITTDPSSSSRQTSSSINTSQQ